MSTDLVVILPASGIVIIILLAWLWTLGRRVSRLEGSVRAVEADLKHLSTKEDITKVTLAMAEMRAEVSIGRESFRALRSSLDRVEGYMHALSLRKLEGQKGDNE